MSRILAASFPLAQSLEHPTGTLVSPGSTQDSTSIRALGVSE